MRNPFYKPVKTSTTVRIDADVLAWLKSEGTVKASILSAIGRGFWSGAVAATLNDIVRLHRARDYTRVCQRLLDWR